MMEYKKGENPSAPLLFQPTEIIALGNTEPTQKYKRGVDWEYDTATNHLSAARNKSLLSGLRGACKQISLYTKGAGGAVFSSGSFNI